MRRPLAYGLALVLAGLAACSAAPASAQNAALPLEHSFVVERASLDIVEEVSTAGLQVLVEEVGCEGTQSPDIITVSEDGTSFTFDERPTGADTGAAAGGTGYTGCAAASANITFPAPVRTLRVNFTVDRQVTMEASNVPPTPVSGGSSAPSLLQEFHLRFPDGSSRIDPYFGNREGNNPPTPIEREYLLPAGTQWVDLRWYFEDEGLGAIEFGEDPGRARLRSTVSGIRLQALDVPLDPPTVAAAQEVEDPLALRGTIAYEVNVTVPEDAVRPAAPGLGMRSADVVLEVRRGANLEGRFGPAGAVPDEAFAARREGDAIFYVISADTVAAQGPGVYTFAFTTVRQLPIPEGPGEPQRIEPFFFTMLLLPAPAAILALYSAVAYRREAHGRYRRASVGILGLVLVGIVYYVLLLAYAIFGAGKAVMTTLPLKPQATLVYVQFIVLLLFFVVTAVVVGRYLVRGMRRDLESRRIQEEKLRRSNEELERFAYVASHDLQEPLRKVAGFTSLLQRRYQGRLDKDADEMIQYAVDGATRMQALIRDILAYSRVGSAELDVRPVETASVMELVVADLGERIKEEKASVTWDGLPTVPADAGQLRQVLQNLVENAIKYRDPKRRPRVRVTAERVGDDWRFAVADNGVGIPADKLHDVFGIFRRLHGAEVPGTGIGLALAKKAVERHGGKIWVESKPGRGSTFHFTIPAGQELPPPRLPWRLGSATPAPAPDTPPPRPDLPAGGAPTDARG